MKRKSVKIAVGLACTVGIMIPTLANAQTPVTTTKVRLAAPRTNQIVSGKRVVLDSDGGTEASPNFKPSAAWFDITQDATKIAKVNYSITGKYGYIAYWDSTTVLNGTYSVTASVKNSAGNVTTSSATSIGVNNSTTATTVVMALPKAGATVSGKPNLVSDGGTIANRGFKPSRVFFTVTNSAGSGTKTANAKATSMGFVTAWDSTAVVNGTYSVTSTAVDANGKLYNSPATSFKVSNPIIVAKTDTWGNHMGLSISLSAENIDHAVALGVKWIRAGRELGWGPNPQTKPLIDYAHSKGLKILWVCQKSAHVYSTSDVVPFANYCADWVDWGVDAIEIGNEWNHVPFWQANPNGDYTLQAAIADETTVRIRAKSGSIPIMNGGWSPESSPNSPAEAEAKLLDASDEFKRMGSVTAHHGLAYGSSGGVLSDKPWNAFLAGTPAVYNAAKARNFNKPIWLTEMSSPSAGKRGDVVMSLESQTKDYQDYITGIKKMRAMGVPIAMTFWHTAQDGQSASTELEKTHGLYDKDWKIKPAGQVVKDQASQPW